MSQIIDMAIKYERAALSNNTLRSYRSLWNKFEKWCFDNHTSSLPASSETISYYLSFIGENVSISTLNTTLASISYQHKLQGTFISGDKMFYHKVKKGIIRLHPKKQKRAYPITVNDLINVCNSLSRKDSLKNKRDKALILVMFFSALRRNELTSLNFEDCEFNSKGVILNLLKSKSSDSVTSIYLSYNNDCDICPVKSLQLWMYKSELNSGPIFRNLLKGGKIGTRLSGHAASQIIKNNFGNAFTAHSARRGLITAIAREGATMDLLKRHSRLKSGTVLLTYIEEANGFKDSTSDILNA